MKLFDPRTRFQKKDEKKQEAYMPDQYSSQAAPRNQYASTPTNKTFGSFVVDSVGKVSKIDNYVKQYTTQGTPVVPFSGFQSMIANKPDDIDPDELVSHLDQNYHVDGMEDFKKAYQKIGMIPGVNTGGPQNGQYGINSEVIKEAGEYGAAHPELQQPQHDTVDSPVKEGEVLAGDKYITQDLFKQSIDLYAEQEGIPVEQAGVKLLNDAVAAGYVIQGYNDQDMGQQGQSSDSNLFKNIIGGAGDSATGFGQFLGNVGGDVVAWTAKQLGADETKTNEMLEARKQHLEDSKISNSVGADQDSIAYKVTKGIGDVEQVIAPAGAGKAIEKAVSKGGNILSKIPGAEKLLSLLSKAPKVVQKGVNLAKQGAIDTVKYDAIANQELAAPKEVALGAGLGVAAGAIGAGLQKGAELLAGKLELAGVVNPQDLRKVAKALGNEKDAQEVGNWMLGKKLFGTKKQIMDKLDNFVDINYKDTQTALSRSSSLHKVVEAKGALTELKKAFGGNSARAGLEDLFTQVNKLLKKATNKGLTLKELDQVQYLQGKYLPNFTKSMEVSDRLAAQGNANLYFKVKDYLEKAATKEGIGNIRLLKKDTQIGTMLSQAISKKESADFARQVLSPFAGSTLGAALSYQQGDSIEGYLKNMIIFGAGGAAANSKFLQSHIANILSKLSAEEKTALVKSMSAIARGGAAEASTSLVEEK